MTRYRLSLSIRYEFDRPTGAGRQLLRVSPARIDTVQTRESCALVVSPAPLESHGFTDFFGNEVTEVVLPAGLSAVRFDLRATVGRTAVPVGLDLSTGRAELAGEIGAVADLGGQSPHHFRAASARIPLLAEIADFARDATADALTTRETVEHLGRALHQGLRFDAGATEVDTPIADAWAGKHGVCQDFSQIMISGLRSLGIPAAYVSGYLRTLPPPGKARLTGADAMHAWVRAWTGARSGWIDYDPTNACFVADDHVTVAFGRDYGDAAPVTGMLRLDGAQTGSHSVDIDEI